LDADLRRPAASAGPITPESEPPKLVELPKLMKVLRAMLPGDVTSPATARHSLTQLTVALEGIFEEGETFVAGSGAGGELQMSCEKRYDRIQSSVGLLAEEVDKGCD
jgi:hypothetical protein